MYTRMMHQAVEYQKTAFDTSFSVMAAFQDHSCDIMKANIEKSRFIPEGSTKFCTYWMDFLKQNRSNCKEYMDNGFDRMNEFFQTADVTPEPVKKAAAAEQTASEPAKTAAPAKKSAPAKKTQAQKTVPTQASKSGKKTE